MGHHNLSLFEVSVLQEATLAGLKGGHNHSISM
jgi:hypothetical protein